LKILFVDDEKWTLEYLERAIDWKELDLDIVGKACNGREAIPLIQERNPDLAVVDIRMPVMDGLALMEWIRENTPGLKVVVLSAFGEFEYARKALSLGASGYLLKPLDETKMIEEIRRITGLIREERNHRQTMDRIQNQLKENRPIIRERLFSRLLVPGADSPGILEELNEPWTEQGDWCLMMISGGTAEACLSLPDGKSGYLLRNTGPGEWVLLCGQASGRERAARIRERLTAESGGNPFILLSEYLPHPDNLHKELRILQKLKGFRFYFPAGGIISREEIRIHTDPAGIDDFRHMDLLLEYLEKGMGLESLTLLEEFFSPIPKESFYDPESVYDYCYRLLIRIRQLNGQPQLKDMTMQTLREYETLEGLITFLRNLVKSTAAARGPADDNGRLIEQVREYMDSNYSRPMGLQDIADAVGLSRNYLCGLFKKETGLNVWDYLTSRRMEEAKRLLHETNDKTYEVALKVGYDNPGYFSRMFRKYVGTSPREYKSRL